MVSSDDKVKLAVAPCGNIIVYCYLIMRALLCYPFPSDLFNFFNPDRLPAEQTSLGNNCAISQRLKLSLSDEQTQTSVNIQEMEELRSNVSKETQPLNKDEPTNLQCLSSDLRTRDIAMLRPNSLPAHIKLTSLDSKMSEGDIQLVPGPLQSMSFKYVESFVSATTTPDLALSPLDISTQSETPFASLLTAPEGNFYSAVTSPLDDTDLTSNHQVDDNSVTEFVKEVILLKETLQEREANLEESKLKMQEIHDQLEQTKSELASVRFEKSLFEDKFNITQTGIKSVVQKVATSVYKMKTDLTEMRTAVDHDKLEIRDTINTYLPKMEGYCNQVQIFIDEDKTTAVIEATQQLQMQSDAKCNNLNKDLDNIQKEISSCEQELQDTQERLREKEKELLTLRESNSKELEELRSKIEKEASEKFTLVKSKSEKEIQDLLNNIKENEVALQMMKETTEDEVALQHERLSAEKEEALNALRVELIEKHNKEMDAKQRASPRYSA